MDAFTARLDALLDLDITDLQPCSTSLEAPATPPLDEERYDAGTTRAFCTIT